jgi:DNA adenine methylase Dam
MTATITETKASILKPTENKSKETRRSLPSVHPFIKYAGGKRQLLPKLNKMIPSSFNRYFEPFVGGGALFFHLASSDRKFTAYISDAIAELITTYKVVRDNPKGLVELLQTYDKEYKKYPSPQTIEKFRGYINPSWKKTPTEYRTLKNDVRKIYPKTWLCEFCKLIVPEELTCINPGKKKNIHDPKNWRWLCTKCYTRWRYQEDYYLRFRTARNKKIKSSNDVEIAAEFIILNKTCHGGLHRVNSEGEFDTPWGKYQNQTIYDSNNLENVSNVLRYSGVTISACDYKEATEDAQKGDFIYLDPPYDGEDSFTSYTPEGFDSEDQVQLATVFRKLSDRGYFVLLSNSDTPFIRELYSGFTIKEVNTRKIIDCKGDERTGQKELIISNYAQDEVYQNQHKQESMDTWIAQ